MPLLSNRKSQSDTSIQQRRHWTLDQKVVVGLAFHPLPSHFYPVSHRLGSARTLPPKVSPTALLLLTPCRPFKVSFKETVILSTLGFLLPSIKEPVTEGDCTKSCVAARGMPPLTRLTVGAGLLLFRHSARSKSAASPRHSEGGRKTT